MEQELAAALPSLVIGFGRAAPWGLPFGMGEGYKKQDRGIGEVACRQTFAKLTKSGFC